MTFGLHTPIPGGSEYHIEFDGPKQKEVITIYLPPVGYTIDRMPDPETGMPTYQLVKCEILGEYLPRDKQKWIKPQLPKDWAKWRDEEKIQQKFNKQWIHPEAERFRAQEWTRRINGCWQAIGNRNNMPAEYVYIPPSAYLYFAWWNPDFGSPKFRTVYFKTFYTLQWAEDNPKTNGVVLSTYRRHGKTSIAGCWTVDMPSRMQYGYAGMQGQAGKKALEFFDVHLMQPFRRLEEVDFFQPKYDKQASQKSQLLFTDPPPKSSKNKPLNYDTDNRKPLGGRITCATSSETSLDGKKQHRIWLDEPGKWDKVDVLKTVLKYVPCTVDDLRQKIGLIFVPSTVEELGKGGKEFVELFEKSVPSGMQRNKNGKTSTGLVSLFIPAYEGVIFDEYGRSIVEDPDPTLIVLDEGGRQITEGAKRFLKGERDSKDTEDDLIEEIRKYPWSWFEAKMSSAMQCRFNAQIITRRLEELRVMPRLPFIRGNYDWADEQDGDVEFRRDDIAGRWQVHWQPDMMGGLREDTNKITNNIGYEWGDDMMGRRIKLWYPRNDQLFTIGCDPIAYKDKNKTRETRLSKGALHVFRKYDPSVDQGKSHSDWESHNFVVQYLFRPDTFEEFAEDVIKMVRYWGCSVNAEDNVQALRQHMDARGYGAFILFRRDFDTLSVMGNGDVDRPIRSNPEVIDTYTNRLNTWFYKHGMRCMFPELLEQALQFDPNDTQLYDCIVSAGYTLIGAEKRMDTDSQENTVDLTTIFPMYNISGNRSKIIP
jgi:hypothetical protein